MFEVKKNHHYCILQTFHFTRHYFCTCGHPFTEEDPLSNDEMLHLSNFVQMKKQTLNCSNANLLISIFKKSKYPSFSYSFGTHSGSRCNQ